MKIFLPSFYLIPFILVLYTSCEREPGAKFHYLEGEWQTLSFEFDTSYSSCSEVALSSDSVVLNSNYILIDLKVRSVQEDYCWLIITDQCDATVREINSDATIESNWPGYDNIIVKSSGIGTLIRLHIISHSDDYLELEVDYSFPPLYNLPVGGKYLLERL